MTINAVNPSDQLQTFLQRLGSRPQRRTPSGMVASLGATQGQITEPLLEIHQNGTVVVGLRVFHISSATYGGARVHQHQCIGKHCAPQLFDNKAMNWIRLITGYS